MIDALYFIALGLFLMAMAIFGIFFVANVVVSWKARHDVLGRPKQSERRRDKSNAALAPVEEGP